MKKIIALILLCTVSSTQAKKIALTNGQIENELSHSHHEPAHADHETMHGMYGRHSMNREASGTSWVPDSSPPEGFHLMHKDWIFMLQGFSYFVADMQGGKKGGKQFFNENMFMYMAQKDSGNATVALRTMFSAESITIGSCGYPLLLQTGETCDGITPLINRQHPHDLFGELALVFSYAPNANTSFFFYAGLPGEPALGPPTYLMRFSGEYIPETPIGHHWMDSTHISFGVLTAGIIYKNIKIESSFFNGKEPDHYRYNIEKPTLNSYALRLSLNPTKNLALQASYGFLKDPEQLKPQVNIQKVTCSAIYNKNFGEENMFQASAIFGLNKKNPGNTLPAFLLETTASLRKKHVPFARFEILQNDELFEEPSPLAGRLFTVKKLTFGYVYEFLTKHHLKWGIGGLIDFPLVPHTIKNLYGNTTSCMFFLQIRLV